MFDEETVNAFSGGFRISEPGIITIFGYPAVSNLKKVISFPVSLQISSLVRKNTSVVWKGINSIEIPFHVSKLTNDWFDPLKLMTNIAFQRGWSNAPYILADELLSFNQSLGYYSAFIDLVVESFSLVNEVNLSTSELMQISGEIQDKIKGTHNSYETLARKQGKEGSLLFYDLESNSYRNEIINLEPYSMFLISENSLDSNPNFVNFQKSFRKFNQGNMISKGPNALVFPYVGIRNHLESERKIFDSAIESLEGNDIESFISSISEYSRSIGYNLGVLSDFQKIIARLLDKYEVKFYMFNVGEYSGSILIFLDSLSVGKVRDNVVRDYYNITNRTIRIDELTVASGSSKEQIRV
ncbi:MAG: hypothetical protein ACP5UZ_03950 [Thermoplasmata archaeon]